MIFNILQIIIIIISAETFVETIICKIKKRKIKSNISVDTFKICVSMGLSFYAYSQGKNFLVLMLIVSLTILIKKIICKEYFGFVTFGIPIILWFIGVFYII